jgi:Raf kinase inhibitor-like YbhB/YbcL family protein
LKETTVAFHLTTTTFQNRGFIPKKFTCDGPDISPALEWTEPPAGTKCFALIVDDPDAPSGTWVHWVLYDLPVDVRKLDEGVEKTLQLPDGARQGRNDFGKIGYDGPCPPRGAPHRYFFKLYALDRKTNLKAGASKSELERAIKDHVLAEAEVVGLFQH